MQKYGINLGMVRSKHCSHKWHWIARKNYYISKVEQFTGMFQIADRYGGSLNHEP